MANPTSFSFTDEFKERLEKLSKSVGKNKTQYMVEAVNAYATGNLPDTALLNRLDALAENNKDIQKILEELRTLVTATLTELQAINRGDISAFLDAKSARNTPKQPEFTADSAPEYSTDIPEPLNNVKFFDKEMVMIPYYGKTAAGEPLDIFKEPGEHILFPRKALKGRPRDYFALSVQGYSMVEDDINEGDLVVIRYAEEPVDGKIMLVRYEDKSTLKRLVQRDKKWYLLWDDGTGREIQVDSGNFQVQGLHVWTIKSGK